MSAESVGLALLAARAVVETPLPVGPSAEIPGAHHWKLGPH